MSRFLLGAKRVLAGVVLALLVSWAMLWVWVTQPLISAAPNQLAVRADAARLRRHVEVLTQEVGPRDSDHPESLAKAAAYLEQELVAAGLPVTLQRYEVRGVEYVNVIAKVGPADGLHVVVGAHYDAFGLAGPNPGADDNASGTAGLVELGRILAAQANSPKGPPLRALVELVAYANEEPPFFASPAMGSAVHAAALAADPPEAMIGFEMIGYFTNIQKWPSRLLEWLYPSHGQFIMVVGRSADRELAAKVKAGFWGRGDISMHSWVGPFVPGMDASDHRSYWERGIPAVMVTDTAFLRNPHYHSAADRAETLDYPKMAQVVEGVANTLLAF